VKKRTKGGGVTRKTYMPLSLKKGKKKNLCGGEKQVQTEELCLSLLPGDHVEKKEMGGLPYLRSHSEKANGLLRTTTLSVLGERGKKDSLKEGRLSNVPLSRYKKKKKGKVIEHHLFCSGPAAGGAKACLNSAERKGGGKPPGGEIHC